MDISVERLFPSGDILLTTLKDGYYIHQRYNGYTLRDAKRMFRAFVAEN